MSAVYDAGALIAAERGDREVWADHRARLEQSIVPVVPTPVLVQVSRSARQVPLRRLLRGCEVVALTEQRAHEAGALLGKAGGTDVTDAVVVVEAIARRADVVTSDPRDIKALLASARTRLRIITVS